MKFGTDGGNGEPGPALGAAIAVLLPIRIAFRQFGLLQGFAFIGALLAILVV